MKKIFYTTLQWVFFYLKIYILTFVSFFYKFLIKKDSIQFRILLFHHIPENDLKKFYNLINYLSKDFDFINNSDFLNFLLGKKKIKRNTLLITFDDGYNSDLDCIKFLKKKKIDSIHFLISDFIKINKKRDMLSFIEKNLFPINKYDMPNLNEVSNIHKSEMHQNFNIYNQIASHSASHKVLSKIDDNNELIIELIKSKELLQSLDINKIMYFSYPFGELQHINQKSLNLLKKNYFAVFSGIRGNNVGQDFFMYRDDIKLSMPKMLIKSILLGLLDFKYAYARKTLKFLLNDIKVK